MSKRALAAPVLLSLALALAGCSWTARYERSMARAREQATEATTPPATAEAPSTIPPRAGFIAPTGPLSPEEERASFTLPPGFEAQLVASEPEIAKPMQLAFDAKGRLLVSTSTGYPLGPPPGSPPTDKVMRLEIDGETGKATKITTVAEGFNICSGIEALPNGDIIVANAPDILLLRDADGDGIAETREVLYTGFARDDTHELPNSFAWGIDGWLYGLQGHVNVSKVKDKRGETTLIAHGGVYRFRPDGSRIEPWARGMSNPWGLAFGRDQEMYGSDCESRPIWQIVRGLPYQGFLQDEDPLGFAPTVTEDPHGASGFAGLVYYSAERFPEEYRDCLYLGNPITGRIHRDRPGNAGATHPMLRQPDLLTSTDPWCRPVDVELGPDGALYVADWYNRIIAHVEVALDNPQRDKTHGRIWRIVYKGEGATPAGPMARDWSAASAKDLLAALAESNASTRRTAAGQLRTRFPEIAERACPKFLISDPITSPRRLESLWLLRTLDALPLEKLTAVLHDVDPVLRSAAIRMISEWPDAALTPEMRNALLRPLLEDTAPQVQRDAALALRLFPTREAFWEIVKHRREAPKEDPLLRYALQFAARDHLLNDAILESVATATPPAEDAARVVDLINATPTPKATETVVALLRAGRVAPSQLSRALKNVFANGGADLLKQFLESTSTATLDEETTRSYADSLIRNAKRIDKLGVDPKPSLQAWSATLARGNAPQSRALAVEIAAEYTFSDVAPTAQAVLADPSFPQSARELAAKLLLTLNRRTAASSVLNVVADTNESASVRGAVAREFARLLEDPKEFEALLAALQGAPATAFAGAIESLSLRKPGVNFLLDAVEQGRISAGHINNHVTRLRIKGTHKDPAIDARYDKLVASAFNAEAEGPTLALIAGLSEKIKQNPNRDVARGQATFEENCMICHRVGGMGALVGPNLDGVGNRGIERVLQDITLPNQDIDPGFRVTSISLDTLESVEGLVVAETGTELVLANATGERHTYAKSQITERSQLVLSLMPTNFSTFFPEDVFLDLVGFLLHPPAKIAPITEKGRQFHASTN